MRGWKRTKKRQAKGQTGAASKKMKLTRRVARNVLRSTLETKCHNVLTDSASLSSSTAAYVYNDLSRVPSGVEDHQRNGDKISAFRLSLKWLWRCATAGTNGNGYVRFVLFAAEKGRFFQATDEFLLDTNNEPVAPTADNLDDIVAPLNKKDISVFQDKLIQFGATDSSTRDLIRTGVMSPKLNMIFNYDSNTTEDARKNNMRLLVIVRGVTTANASSGILTFRSRLFYKDV